MKNSIALYYPTFSFSSFIFLIFSLLVIPGEIDAQVIYLADTVIAPHEKIKLTFDSFPGNANDYIALAYKVQAPENYVGYYFLNGQKKGSLEFDGTTYGEYELRGFYSNIPVIKTKIRLRIGNKDQTPKIMSDKPVFLPSEKISVSFSGFPGNQSDWISIAQPGSAPSSYAEYIFLNKKQSGTIVFDVKPFGVYELRGYFNNEYVIQTTTQLIIGDQNLTITPDKQTFKSGEPVTLKYAGFPGNQNDWISLSKAGSNAGQYVTFQYLNKLKGGTLTFSNVTDGDYELRGYVNGENIIRVKSSIKVGEGSAALINQTPGNINIQGVLTNASGVAVPNGPYVITFRLYDALQSDSVRWEEKLSNINVVSGVFSAILGKTKPFTINFDKPYFLGIQVGLDQELKPRIELTSTPYSLMAKSVENNSISSEKIQPNAVTLDKIATPLLSSINGIANDGGNVNIVAGANVTIINDDKNKTITISAVNPGGGTAGISRINPGNAIAVTGQDGPTTTISVAPNSIGNNELQPNAITTDKIVPNVVSSISGVTNDGGNINLLAGNNINLVTDNVNKSITISATNGTGGTSTITQLTEGNGISIQNPAGPFPTIGLKPNILLGPSGSLGLLNQNSTLVASFSSSINQGGSISTSNAQGTQMFGVSNFSDGQPFLYMNSKLGRQIVDLKANDESDAEMNLKSSSGTTVLRLATNATGGGLVNVFNQIGNTAARLTTRPIGDGLLTINNVANNKVMEIRSNSGGGGYLGLTNELGTEVLRLTTRIVGSGGSASILSGTGLPAVDLTTNDENGGGLIGIYNADGNRMIQASTFLNRQPFILLKNRLENPVLDLRANEFSDGELTLGSALNNLTVRLTANENAGGLINVFNRGERISSTLTNDPDGAGYLRINSQDENEIISLSQSVQGGGYIAVSDEKKSEIVSITGALNGGGFVGINNRLGGHVAKLEANEFSDGELELYSVLQNPTVRITANDNAGGLINVFSQVNKLPKIAARLTEEDGGKFSIFNTDETEIIQLSALPNRNARIRVNNRLNNPVADLISNDFSDGELTLSSSSKNPTVQVGANDNAGGQINVFNKASKISAKISEANGFGIMKIFNPDGKGLAEMSEFKKAGRVVIYNPEMDTIRGVASMYTDSSGYGIFGVASKTFGGLAELTGDSKENGYLRLNHSTKNSSLPLVYIGGSNKSDGFLKLFNAKGLISAELLNDSVSLGGKLSVYNKDSKVAANLLAGFSGSGLIQLNNNKNNLSAGFLADDNGGKLFIGDGGPFVSPRVDLSTTATGSQLLLYSNATNLMHSLTIKPNGEGLLEIRGKKSYPKNAVEMGGDDNSAGYLRIFNSKGLNTTLWGHNEFDDGHIELKNNLGNLGVHMTAYGDGGSVIVTDGKPGINHRIAMDAGLNGGKLSIYNKDIKLVSDLSVGDNGEGQWRIPAKTDLTKNRLILGADNSGAGYLKFYNGSAIRFLETGALGDGAGYLATYNKVGKQLTNISPSGNAGGAFTIMNDNENIVGVMAYDGTGGTVYMSNKDRIGGSWVSTNALGGSLFIRNNAGKQNGEMITTASGGDLNLYSSTGIQNARLGQVSNGSGILEIGTPNGDKVVRVTTSDGTGFIGLDNIDKLEVVRITANLGKGGGMALRNDKGNDMIKLTQDQSYGAILVNNVAGNLIASVSHNSMGGGTIFNKDSKGGDAVLITSNDKGGGNVTTYNDLGKVSASINMNDNSQGRVLVNGSTGNEIASMTGTSTGSGKVVINNSTGVNLAGMINNSTTGGGTVYANNSSGSEVVRITSESTGNGTVTIDNSVGIRLAGIAKNSANGGLVFANNSTGKQVIRMATAGTGAGYLQMDNSAGSPIVSLLPTINNTGYISVANATGGERARLFVNTTGGGYLGAANPAGSDVSIITHTASDGEGYIGVTNNAGSERAYMIGGDFGGTMILKDKSNNIRLTSNVSGMQADAVDGSRMTLGTDGLVFFDKSHIARAQINSTNIFASSPAGNVISFLGGASPTLGYVAVFNSSVPGNVPKAGMYVDAATNKGIVFGDMKNFRMDYPGKPDKEIWYGSIEGPELAAYIRGTGKLINGKASIEFPDHYIQVANAKTMTVILTPLSGKSKGLAVVNKKTTGFEVEELMEGTGEYEFDWEVKCVRKGYENYDPVRNKSDEPKPLLPETRVSQSMETKTGNKVEVTPDIKVKIEATTINN